MVSLNSSMSVVKNILIGFTGLLCSLTSRGQAHFLYFQADPAQPFEVIYAGASHKASEVGYLILSGLPAQEIEFVLVLAGQSRYRMDMSAGDRGLSVRKQDSSWRLWDLSSNQWLEPRDDSRQGSEEMDSTGASSFARLLSKAAKDPSLLSNKRKGLSKSLSVNDSKSSRALPVGQTQPASGDPVLVDRETDSLVWQADYYVSDGQEVDTVRVSIWSDRAVAPDTAKALTAPRSCAALLSEPEFLQLRTRMAGATDEDEMVSQVRRVVRTHCFSISQARRLSSIFLNDATRYRFFDTLHGRVSDPESFHTLGSFLTDPVYQKRFRTLTQR